MTIQKSTTPYEILIRLDAAGYKASHVKDLVTLSENGEVLSVTEGMARPITLVECQELLGGACAELIERCDRLVTQHADDVATIAALDVQLDQKGEEVTQLQAEVVELQKSLAAVQQG